MSRFVLPVLFAVVLHVAVLLELSATPPLAVVEPAPPAMSLAALPRLVSAPPLVAVAERVPPTPAVKAPPPVQPSKPVVKPVATRKPLAVKPPVPVKAPSPASSPAPKPAPAVRELAVANPAPAVAAPATARVAAQDAVPPIKSASQVATSPAADVLVSKPRFAQPPRAPQYPSQARRRKQEGVVLVEVRLDAQGAQRARAVLQSSGFAQLDAAALEAVSSWQFLPEQNNGRGVPSRVQIPVRFALAGR